MKCKKCGFEGIEENADWITCPNCGAKYFNTSINPEISATKQIDEIESRVVSEQTAAPAVKGKKRKKKKSRKASFRKQLIFCFRSLLL